MNCSIPGFPVLHYLPEFAWTCVHWVSDAVQLSHPLLPLLLLPSIFLRIRIFSNELALCIRWPKYWRFSFSISYSNNIQGWFPLELTGLISLLSKSLLQQFKAQFRSINSSMFSLIYGANFTSILDYWKKQLWLYGPLLAKWCLCFLIHCLDLS